MADLTLNRNDYGFDINFTVKKADGSAYDLTAHTVVFNMSDRQFNTKIKEGACVITDAVNGLCKYTVQATDLDLKPGIYRGELQLTIGGKVISNPVKISIEIVAECG